MEETEGAEMEMAKLLIESQCLIKKVQEDNLRRNEEAKWLRQSLYPLEIKSPEVMAECLELLVALRLRLKDISMSGLDHPMEARDQMVRIGKGITELADSLHRFFQYAGKVQNKRPHER